MNGVRDVPFVGGGVLLILIISGIILGWSIRSNHGRLIELTKKWDALQPTSLEVAKLKTAKESFQKKAKAMESLMLSRMHWSRKLNQLSDLMPDGVWLNHISISSRAEMIASSAPPPKDSKEKEKTAPKAERREYKVLVLRGNTMSVKRGEVILDLVGKFMERLKNDEGFFQDFSNVELTSIERDKISDTEVMRFEITCRFK